MRQEVQAESVRYLTQSRKGGTSIVLATQIKSIDRSETGFIVHFLDGTIIHYLRIWKL